MSFMCKCSVFRVNECICALLPHPFTQMTAYFVLINSKRCSSLDITPRPQKLGLAGVKITNQHV